MTTIEQPKKISVGLLSKHLACQASKAWLSKQTDTSARALWDTCPNGAWMLWVTRRLIANHELVLPSILRLLQQELNEIAVALLDYNIDCGLADMSCTTKEDFEAIHQAASQLYDSIQMKVVARQLPVSVCIINYRVCNAAAAANCLSINARTLYSSAAMSLCIISKGEALANDLRASVDFDALLASIDDEAFISY